MRLCAGNARMSVDLRSSSQSIVANRGCPTTLKPRHPHCPKPTDARFSMRAMLIAMAVVAGSRGNWRRYAETSPRDCSCRFGCCWILSIWLARSL